jgi:hypothetical protein
MASGRNPAHTAEAEHPSAGSARSFVDTAPTDPNARTVADTERLGLEGVGVDRDVADRPAHQWEVGGADSWEPSVTDTWNPPAAHPPASANRPASTTPPASARPPALPAERSVPPAVPPTERAAQSARQALDQALRSAGLEAEAPAPEMDPARMALSLATLAAERMRAGVPAGDGLVTGLGLARQTANGLRALGGRLLEPASRLTVGALQNAARLPVAGLPARAALRSGQWVARSGAQAREKLRAWFEGVRVPNHETLARESRSIRVVTSPSMKDSPQRTSTNDTGAADSRP